jgi:SAM-dependent methyltransferase
MASGAHPSSGPPPPLSEGAPTQAERGARPPGERGSEFSDYATSESYRSEVERSFDFAGLKHDLFVSAKAEALLELARRRLGDLRTRSALDVGCGVGLMQRYVAPAFARSAGVDISGEALEEGKRNFPGSELQSYDGERLPWDAASFDLTFAVNVMHHVPPARWSAFSRELLRVTKPGGVAVVFEHNPLNPLTRLAVFRCAFDKDAVLLRRSKTRRLLTEAGGALVEQRYILFVPIHARWARRADQLLAPAPIGAQYFVAVTPA